MILIAHKDDCGIVKHGPTIERPLGYGVGELLPRVCSCGGIRIRVMEAEAHDKDTFKLVGRVEE